MSRNFELLSEIEAELETAHPEPAPQAATAPSHTREPGTAAYRKLVDQPPLDPNLFRLAQQVFFAKDCNTPHEVVLCGVDHEADTSTVCLELGRILAICSEQPVCIVDGDIQAGRLTKLLDQGSPKNRLTPACRNMIEGLQNLWLASTDFLDPSHMGVMAPAEQLKTLLAELDNKFTFVLIDAPGVNVRGDATLLCQLADAAILIIEANKTRKAGALQARKTLEAMNVRLLGSILNNRTYPIPEKVYRNL